MTNIILIIITALGSLGETWSHKAFDALEAWVTNSKTPVDNALFYKAHKYICSWTPKNPPVE
jgi:hypothetical protein